MNAPSLSQSVRYLVAGLALCSAATASVISWNLDRYGTLAPANIAGVVSVANWNNSWPSNPTVNLVDDTGAASTLDLAYSSFNQWSVNEPSPANPGMDANGTFNRNLLNGYLNAGNAAWGPPTTSSSVTLTQIPFAQYSIIVYFSSDAAGREGDVTDGTSTFSFNTIGPASVSGFDAILAQTTAAGGVYTTAANYAIFAGLSGGTQTITVQMRDNDEWGGIAGFQVVSIPEPSAAAALMGAAVLVPVLLRRRRK